MTLMQFGLLPVCCLSYFVLDRFHPVCLFSEIIHASLPRPHSGPSRLPLFTLGSLLNPMKSPPHLDPLALLLFLFFQFDLLLCFGGQPVLAEVDFHAVEIGTRFSFSSSVPYRCKNFRNVLRRDRFFGSFLSCLSRQAKA